VNTVARREKKQSGFGLKGLRHLALRVRDIGKARSFYEGLLGMKVVWEPDPENVYLSSGCDNLALHQIPEGQLGQFESGTGQLMDHFGFIVENPDAVNAFFHAMQQADILIIKPLKTHRDGSVSFYMADPDKNVIQILYEPTISKL
jgi:catechol 2,3-dioxygenase-like lactoylglutathione lyase family enzyme